MSRRYRVVYLVMDTDGLTDGDWQDFRRDIDRLEVEHNGVHLLGIDGTHSWPSVTAHESAPAPSPEPR